MIGRAAAVAGCSSAPFGWLHAGRGGRDDVGNGGALSKGAVPLAAFASRRQWHHGFACAGITGLECRRHLIIKAGGEDVR